MLLLYSNVSSFTQNLIKVFSWPKIDEGCWNYHMIPVNSLRLFCHFGYYFAVDLVITLP